MENIIKLSAAQTEGLSLAKLLKDFLVSNQILTDDKARLGKATKVRTRCR